MRCSWMFIISAFVLLSACSSAGWGENYGPRGEGFVGSSLGYSEAQITDNKWRVEYVDAIPEAARLKAIQRANEICIDHGYSEAEINPSISHHPHSELVSANGIATCVN